MSNSYNALVSTLTAHRAAASKDIGYVLKSKNSVHFFSETTMLVGEELGIDWDIAFSNDMGQKQVKRLTQFVNACAVDMLSQFDTTHARLLIAMRLAGQYNLTTDALHALSTGARKDSVNTRGITQGQMNAIIKVAQGMGTVTSKTSNSTGKNGFMQVQGMTFAAPERNHEVMLNLDHPAIARFFTIYDTSSKAQIEAFNAKGSDAE